jgi:hypothetical protein
MAGAMIAGLAGTVSWMVLCTPLPSEQTAM